MTKYTGVREEVSTALVAAGYAIYNSGGGVMLWSKDLPDDNYLLLSYDDEAPRDAIAGEPGLDGDPTAKSWMVTRNDEDCGFIQLTEERFTLSEAIAAGERIPAVTNGAQEDFATLDEAISSRLRSTPKP